MHDITVTACCCFVILVFKNKILTALAEQKNLNYISNNMYGRTLMITHTGFANLVYKTHHLFGMCEDPFL